MCTDENVLFLNIGKLVIGADAQRFQSGNSWGLWISGPSVAIGPLPSSMSFSPLLMAARTPKQNPAFGANLISILNPLKRMHIQLHLIIPNNGRNAKHYFEIIPIIFSSTAFSSKASVSTRIASAACASGAISRVLSRRSLRSISRTSSSKSWWMPLASSSR